MNPLLSIITPVYNVESYLDRCIQSILTQSYYHIELILIDDGSSDRSSVICDEWSVKDNRVRVIVDMLQYPYCQCVSEDEIIIYHKPATALLEGTVQIFKNWWAGKPLEYVIWNKIYKRELWDGVTFREGHISEDTCLVPIFVGKVKKVFISDKGLYYYQRDRKDSYTFGEYDFDKNIDLFYAHAAIYECFSQFPDLITEKVLAFTRLYRRLITAKQTDLSADIHAPLRLIKHNFPSWLEIIKSRDTEKLWLIVAKMMGGRLFVNLFLRYLKA